MLVQTWIPDCNAPRHGANGHMLPQFWWQMWDVQSHAILYLTVIKG